MPVTLTPSDLLEDHVIGKRITWTSPHQKRPFTGRVRGTTKLRFVNTVSISTDSADFFVTKNMEIQKLESGAITIHDPMGPTLLTIDP